MPGGEAVKERIEQLIAQVSEVSASDAYQQKAWLIAAQRAVQLVCVSASDPYYVDADRIVGSAVIPLELHLVAEMAALIRRLREEIELGLLTTIENHAIALTFDDFLDHGAEYLKHGRKNEAGVIAGIVFEDTIRRICRVLGVPENGVALETLIVELTKQGILTQLKAKRARAAAGLRTSAAHARWEEIDLGDVAPVIELTKELIETHLG
jgi:uncharacterized protein YutE (UPF0331/DUF86 family)